MEAGRVELTRNLTIVQVYRCRFACYSCKTIKIKSLYNCMYGMNIFLITNSSIYRESHWPPYYSISFIRTWILLWKCFKKILRKIRIFNIFSIKKGKNMRELICEYPTFFCITFAIPTIYRNFYAFFSINNLSLQHYYTHVRALSQYSCTPIAYVFPIRILSLLGGG